MQADLHFFVHRQDSILSTDATPRILRPLPASTAEQAGFSLNLLPSSEDGFSCEMAQMKLSITLTVPFLKTIEDM